MNYFRAVLRSNEKSERVLELTTHLLHLNPSHYTIWQYRRATLNGLQGNLSSEYEWFVSLSLEHPKNYQLWYHRQWIVKSLVCGGQFDYTREFECLAEMIEEEPKNYHLWAYRQWFVREFGLWQNEFAFVQSIISADVYNNSAWNYRFWLMENSEKPTEMQDEVAFVIDMIKKEPANHSSWNYLQGLKRAFKVDESAIAELLAFFAGGRFAPLLSFIVDNAHERRKQGMSVIVTDAVRACDILANEVDPIRRAYWNHRQKLLSA